jgi:transposase-like protein
MGKRYSNTRKAEIVKSIQEMLDKGIRTEDACKQFDISVTAFHKWSKESIVLDQDLAFMRLENARAFEQLVGLIIRKLIEKVESC